MNDLRKYLHTCLLATAALLVGGSPAWAQVSLGAASEFAVLGGTNVTCTGPGSITGDVGVSPGSAVPFTNTGCVITGAFPPATNIAAAGARTAFLSAYAAAQAESCTGTLLSTITGPLTLYPGVYCTGAALTGTGVLTLDAKGDANAVWIFKIGAALTGTGFSVIMTNGGQACNVYWVPDAAVTLTSSAFSGNILAGNATLGSITSTGGSLAGRALANVAVSMTGPAVVGCAALPSPPPSCTGKDCNEKGKGPGKCNDGKDDDKGQQWGSTWFGGWSKDDKGNDSKK
jgi:hypothetical protein